MKTRCGEAVAQGERREVVIQHSWKVRPTSQDKAALLEWWRRWQRREMGFRLRTTASSRKQQSAWIAAERPSRGHIMPSAQRPGPKGPAPSTAEPPDQRWIVASWFSKSDSVRRNPALAHCRVPALLFNGTRRTGWHQASSRAWLFLDFVSRLPIPQQKGKTVRKGRLSGRPT
jgi:hypothetical protein